MVATWLQYLLWPLGAAIFCTLVPLKPCLPAEDVETLTMVHSRGVCVFVWWTISVFLTTLTITKNRRWKKITKVQWQRGGSAQRVILQSPLQSMAGNTQALINLAEVVYRRGRGVFRVAWRRRKWGGSSRERESEAWLALLISQNLSCFGLSSRSKLALKAVKNTC